MFKKLHNLHIHCAFSGQTTAGQSYPVCDDLSALRQQVLELVTPGGELYSGQATYRMANIKQVAELDYVQAAESLRASTEITDIIHIGIGGSYLGPKLVHDVLNRSSVTGPRIHFLANIDADGVTELTAGLDPTKTAVVVVSKSFGTLEAMLNAEAVVVWMQNQHVYCVTSNADKAKAKFPTAKTFEFPAEIGGRYSIWTAVSFALIARFGADAYAEFLQGGAAVDQLLQSDETTLPVELGFTDYQAQINGAHDHVLIPYASRMKLLPDYYQQLSMESLGKPGDVQQGEVIFGDVGTLYQHSFQQLLMQGRIDNQVEIILPMKAEGDEERQRWLLANGIAQVKALSSRAGNKQAGPVNLLACDAFTPRVLGELLSLYEYRVMTQAVLMKINPFDQPGVEAAKLSSRKILEQLPADGISVSDIEKVLS